MTGWTIRRLEHAEMAEAATLFRAAFNARLPWLADRHTPAEDAAFWQDVLFHRCAISGVLEEGRLLGILARNGDWIEQLYVAPAAQGHGVGSALMEAAKAASPRLTLWTFERNRDARRFYEARGFVVTGTGDGSGNEEGEPDILYEWARAG